MSFFGEKFGLFIRNPYLCNLLLLIIGAFGRQSSMRCVAIISRPVSSLFIDGVTQRSDWRDEGDVSAGDEGYESDMFFVSICLCRNGGELRSKI